MFKYSIIKQIEKNGIQILVCLKIIKNFLHIQIHSHFLKFFLMYTIKDFEWT